LAPAAFRKTNPSLKETINLPLRQLAGSGYSISRGTLITKLIAPSNQLVPPSGKLLKAT